MEATSVLVLSTDVLAAALLGALAEVEGGTPHFPHEGEAPRDAVRRVRARLVLLDCEWPVACSAAVIGPATMVGSVVALFARPARAAWVRGRAARFGVAVLEIPPAPGALRALLAAPRVP